MNSNPSSSPVSDRGCAQGWLWFWVGMFLLTSSRDLEAAPETTGTRDPNRVIQYRGPMPFLRAEHWGTKVTLKFELYRSPDGGTPFWTESRSVGIGSNGWVAVDLGEVEPLPDEAFRSPFRFLGIWRDNVEFVPRKQVANVVYVASDAESEISRENYLELASHSVRAAAAKAPNRHDRLDSLLDIGAVAIEVHPREPVTWLDAAAAARRLGARLPTFEEWYAANDGPAFAKLVALRGHYEWVVPWVYDPAIHARMNALYRGKPVACYYNELSPLNAYSYRLVQPVAEKKR
jgi:hypothetical protein